MRRQKLKLEELKIKSRVAIKQGTTDEDRAHQLKMQEIKLRYELEKEKVRPPSRSESPKILSHKRHNRDLDSDEDPYLGSTSTQYYFDDDDN